MNRANDIFGQILLVLFFVVMVVTPLVIIVLGILNFRRDQMLKVRGPVQALAALVIWVFLTVAIFTIFIMTVYSYPVNTSQDSEIKSTLIFTLSTVFYVLVGGGLIFWTKWQGKTLPKAL